VFLVQFSEPKITGMSTSLEIEQMTLDEKLRVMEALWDDLCRKETLPVHQWQKDLLDERERLVREGKAQFVDWESAKKRIAEQIS
jgi:Putative addiction module component